MAFRVAAVVSVLLVRMLYLPDTAAARTVDCFADEVVRFHAAFAPPESGQRVPELPGIVTGPPGDSLPVSGSTSTVSLGHAGWILLEFTDNTIHDGPGPDFIVFENVFFRTSVPADPNQPFTVFAEPATVAVSDDGVLFFTFPHDPDALVHVGQNGTPSSALPLLRGLAGITPTFTGNWTVPDDPDVWDPSGSGGVSGAGGDAFDLADVGLAQARYVLITDLDLGTGFAGPAEGFDLDSIVALHSMPVAPGEPDADGDGLSDQDESLRYASNPFDRDTDGDGEDDGAEAARCRSPRSASMAPFFVPEPELRMAQGTGGGAGTWATWSFISSSSTYDVVRGEIAAPGSALPAGVTCVEDNSFNLSSPADAQGPAPGRLFFYLVRVTGQADYGFGSAGAPRSFTSGDCP